MIKLISEDVETGTTLNYGKIHIHELSQKFNDVFGSTGKAYEAISELRRTLNIDKLKVKQLETVAESLVYVEKQLSKILIDILTDKPERQPVPTPKTDKLVDTETRYSAAGQPIDIHIKENDT